MDVNYPQGKLRQKITKRNPSSDRGTVKNRGLGGNSDLFPIYGRDRELEQLEEWILDDDCRLIDIYGMSGIGKTALVRQLATQIGDEFDRTIWVNLRTDRSVLEFIDRDLLPYLSIDLMPDASWDLEQRISILMEKLSQHRYLIILDNLQQVFSNDQLAGVYSDSHQGYQELLAQFSNSNHQSCILLIGWEEPQDLALLADKNRLVRSLALDGLSIDAQQQILQDRGILNGEGSLEIFANCGGNPLYLVLLARTIKDCFGGNIDDLPRNCQSFLTNDIKLILQCQFDRLSLIEHQVLDTIAAGDRALSFADLLPASQIPPADLLTAIQSLKRRGMIDRQETDHGMVFDMEPIVREVICLGKVRSI
jgi:hypothetical protein